MSHANQCESCRQTQLRKEACICPCCHSSDVVLVPMRHLCESRCSNCSFRIHHPHNQCEDHILRQCFLLTSASRRWLGIISFVPCQMSKLWRPIHLRVSHVDAMVSSSLFERPFLLDSKKIAGRGGVGCWHSNNQLSDHCWLGRWLRRAFSLGIHVSVGCPQDEFETAWIRGRCTVLSFFCPSC